MLKSQTISVARLRASARAPRLWLIAACAVVTAGGAVRTFAGPAPAAPPARHVISADTTVEQGLAERFTTAFLNLEVGGDAHRESRLRALGLADSAAVADRVGRRQERVAMTSVADAARVLDGADVTVAALVGGQWRYVLVPVRRRSGRFFIAGPPAVVSAPAVALDELAPSEDEVQSAALKQVAGRVMRHYLAGERADLVADLAPRASAATPVSELRVASVEAVTWAAAPRRVAVLLRARGSRGLRLTLRYELGVVRRDGRWLVTGIADTPTHEERPR